MSSSAKIGWGGSIIVVIVIVAIAVGGNGSKRVARHRSASYVPQVAATTLTTTTAIPTGTGSGQAASLDVGPETDVTICRGTQIAVSRGASCPFAENVTAGVFDFQDSHNGTVPGTVIAHSPVTHLTYTLICVLKAEGSEIDCSTESGATITLSNEYATTSTSSSGSSSTEGPGSTTHAEDAAFCSQNQCIANFANGNGYVVQCADGEWSHSGGLPGACSDHGGEDDNQ